MKRIVDPSFQGEIGATGRVSPVVARFEAWLRSRGYQLQRDPFLPNMLPSESDVSDEGAKLVGEYLTERSKDEPYRGLLLGYASDGAELLPLWGDGSGGNLELHRTR